MYKNFIGVDPGKTGAIAVVSDIWEDAEVFDMPETKKGLRRMADKLSEYTQALVVIEDVHAIRGARANSTFEFGRQKGLVEMAFCLMPNERVYPVTWQKALKCLTGGDKKISYNKAVELFPNTDGITKSNADALLIAEYARRTYGNRAKNQHSSEENLERNTPKGRINRSKQRTKKPSA